VGFVEPADHALGRSRGGLSSKVHLCCDGRGLPLSFTLTAGQAGDNPQLLAVLDAISVHTGRPGRSRSRPERLLADKAYSHPSTRAALRARGIKATIPERDDQLARRRARGPGRPYAFDAELYKQRNVVERCFNRLKQWRGIATRYDKTARNYRGGVLLASLILWTRA
jgi:transposase